VAAFFISIIGGGRGLGRAVKLIRQGFMGGWDVKQRV
jgi:hypothetical protein